MHLSHLLKQPRIFPILLVCCVVLPQNSRAQDQAPQFERSTLIAAAQEIMLTARYCTLVTLDASGQPHVRTMDPFESDGDMVIRLGTFRNSRKVGHIRNDPRVALHYLSPSGSGYVSISGTARLVDDPAEKARYWKNE